ncbi:MAG: ABC transporter ATP-binding protein [Candidatus Brocadiia bacterium]
MQKQVIDVEKLTKIFKSPFNRYEVKAVDALDLKVCQGEIFGFLGPNGSGKTTTMKILLGLLKPTSGEVRVLDKPPYDIVVKDRIGFLPEESYLYRFLNAEETLHFFGRIFRMPGKERDRKVSELIELVGLQDARKRPVREYSKGMARRLGFATALINNPDLIFLDEPTSGLDPIVSRLVKDIILDLKKQGKTIFMSSHLLGDVQDICDRIAIMHLGQLQTTGNVKDLLLPGETLETVFLKTISAKSGPASGVKRSN